MGISIDPLDVISRIWKALRPPQPRIAATARNEFSGSASEWFVFPADRVPHLAQFDGAEHARALSQNPDALYVSPCWMTVYIHNISELATQNILVRELYLEVRGFHPLQSDDSFTLVIHWAPAAGPYVAGPVWDVDLSDPSPRAIPLMKESATFIEPESSFRSFLVGEIKD